MKACLIIFMAIFALLACSEPPTPQNPEQSAAGAETQAAQPPQADPITIDAPAGEYKLDPYHSSLDFSVTHLGLSNYVMRFTDFEVALDLDPDDLSSSSVKVTIDPTSISTDFDGDYKETHPDSPFSSWEEDLAQSPKFLNADEYPRITFESNRVTPTDEGILRIEGDLSMLGKTQPVTLEAELVGSVAEHPMMGTGALGFSATGSFKRSDFGMTHLLEPPMVGDTVTVRFEGELHQVVEEDAAADASE